MIRVEQILQINFCRQIYFTLRRLNFPFKICLWPWPRSYSQNILLKWWTLLQSWHDKWGEDGKVMLGKLIFKLICHWPWPWTKRVGSYMWHIVLLVNTCTEWFDNWTKDVELCSENKVYALPWLVTLTLDTQTWINIYCNTSSCHDGHFKWYNWLKAVKVMLQKWIFI